MNIFEQYGIKEVADVCLYSIELDENDDEVYVPVLYLDTLKVSTIEETAEQTSARGGLGNPELIIWDYGKEITVNLEDALYSPASQSMIWGGKYGTKHFTLKGQLNILNEEKEKTGEVIPVKVIIKDFNDFKTPKDRGVYTAYSWSVTINVISDDNQINFISKNCMLSYDIQQKKWSVASLGSVEGIMMGDVDQDGEVDLFDVVKLNMFLLSPNENPIKPKGALAGDVVQDGNEGIPEDKRDELIAIADTSYMVTNNVTNLDQSDSGLIMNYVSGMIDKSQFDKIPIKDLFILSVDEDNPCPPQEVIYQIDHSLQNVHFLDRMEKCIATQTFCIDTITNTKHGNYRYLQQYSQCELTVFIDPRTMQPYEPNTDNFIRKNGKEVTGELRVIKQHEIYYKWTRSKAIDNTSLGSQIIVDAIHFPGTYRLVGETYSRSRKTGKDQRYQFEIPLCKMGTENNLTLQADGDPTTFNMTLKVLRREDGVMMKLTQFDVAPAKYDGYTSDSTVVVPGDEVVPTTPENTGVV